MISVLLKNKKEPKLALYCKTFSEEKKDKYKRTTSPTLWIFQWSEVLCKCNSMQCGVVQCSAVQFDIASAHRDIWGHWRPDNWNKRMAEIFPIHHHCTVSVLHHIQSLGSEHLYSKTFHCKTLFKKSAVLGTFHKQKYYFQKQFWNNQLLFIDYASRSTHDSPSHRKVPNLSIQ